MHFSLQHRPESPLKKPWVIFGLVVLLAVVCGAAYAYQGTIGMYIVLILALVVFFVSFVFFSARKGIPEFDTTDQGILAGGTLYAWPEFKYYSWYGETQDERIGMVGMGKWLSYDPTDLNGLEKTQVLELHAKSGRTLQLEVDSPQKTVVAQILDRYGVKHISLLRKIVGY